MVSQAWGRLVLIVSCGASVFMIAACGQADTTAGSRSSQEPVSIASDVSLPLPPDVEGRLYSPSTVFFESVELVRGNTNVRDGGMGSLCWATRELARLGQGLALAQAAESAGLQKELASLSPEIRNEVVPSRSAAIDRLVSAYEAASLAEVVDAALLEYKRSLGEELESSIGQFEARPRDDAIDPSELAIELSRLSGIDVFVRQAESDPSCSRI